MAPTKGSRARKATPVSSKVSVKTNKSKVTSRPAAVAALPEDWPAQSKAPKLPANASALRPGPLLRETCNGRDIHLTKQAVAEPNILKERGRYLFVMPGMLSLNQSRNNNNRTLSQTKLSQDDTIQASQEEEDLEESLSQPLLPEPSQQSQSEEAKTAGTEIPRLGRVVGLSTRNPKLIVSFPGEDGKALVFPGTKVSTSSKYMWLTCSSKKKGSVGCKNIFSSAIVFGKPSWEGSTANSEGDMDIGTDDTPGDSTSPCHYGGSERTVDSVVKGRKKSLSTSQVPQATTDSAGLIPIVSQETIHDDIGVFKPVNRGVQQASNISSQASRTLSDDEDDDDEEYSATNAPTETFVRNVPKRQASAKKTKYAMDESASSSSSGEESEGDSKPKQTAARKKQTPSKPVAKRTNTKSRSAKKSSSTDSSEEDDHWSGEDDSEAEQAKPRTRAPRRRSSGRKSYKEVAEEDSGDDDNESAEDDPPRKPTSRRATQRSKGKEEPVEVVHIGDSAEEDSVEIVAPTKRSTKQRTARRTSVAKKPPSYTDLRSSDDDGELNEDENQSPNAPASRKTRRKAAPTKAVRQTSSSKSTSTDDARKSTSKRVNGSSKATTTRKRKLSSVTKAVDESDDFSNTEETTVKEVKPPPKRSRRAPAIASKAPTVNETSASKGANGTKKMASPTASASPFRSRRRRSSQGKPKTSPAAKVLDLTADDDFSFG